MQLAEALIYCRDAVRRDDPHRFYLSQLMPQSSREAYWILAAFHLELARIAETVREPVAGAIRLKWWLEVLEQVKAAQHPRQHPVCIALNEFITRYPDSIPTLQTTIEAYEPTLHRGVIFQMQEELHRFCQQTSGLMLALLEGGDEDTSTVGSAYTHLNLLRALPLHLARRQCFIPGEILQQHGLNPTNVLDKLPPMEQWGPVINEMALRIVQITPKTRVQRLNQIYINYYVRQLIHKPLSVFYVEKSSIPIMLQIKLLTTM